MEQEVWNDESQLELHIIPAIGIAKWLNLENFFAHSLLLLVVSCTHTRQVVLWSGEDSERDENKNQKS